MSAGSLPLPVCTHSLLCTTANQQHLSSSKAPSVHTQTLNSTNTQQALYPYMRLPAGMGWHEIGGRAHTRLHKNHRKLCQSSLQKKREQTQHTTCNVCGGVARVYKHCACHCMLALHFIRFHSSLDCCCFPLLPLLLLLPFLLPFPLPLPLLLPGRRLASWSASALRVTLMMLRPCRSVCSRDGRATRPASNIPG